MSASEEVQVQKVLLNYDDNLEIKQDSSLVKALRSCCFLPQRYILGLMGLLGVCNAYTMRVCLNLAIMQMVNQTKYENHDKVDPDACVGDEELFPTNLTTARVNSTDVYNWDEETQGFILSGFYYGYATTQFLGGYLSEKVGGKWTVGVGLLYTAILTFLTPVAVRVGGSTWLFLLRVFQGIGEGPTIPGLMLILARWVPPYERAMMGAMIFGGSQIGTIFGSYATGALLRDGGDWALVFYFFGGFGILWFILWGIFCYSTPNSHPFITKKELDYLNKTIIRAENSNRKDPVPWRAMLTSAPVWALVAAAIGHDWGYYTMVTDLPKYSHDVLKFNVSTTGTLTALPYIAMWMFSFVFGFLCDYSLKKRWHSIKTGRIIYTTIAATGPAICIILASYAGCNRTAAMVYFVVSMALMAGFYGGMKVNSLDLAPNHAGTLTSLMNTISTFGGIIMPYLIGWLTPDSTLVQWRLAFWVCFGVLVGTNIIYIFWAEGDQLWWDDVRKYGYPESWKHAQFIQVDASEIEKKKEPEKEAESKDKV